MMLGILGFIFSLLGIVGYFNGLPLMAVIGAAYIIIEAIIGLSTGELRNISTYIIAICIGFFISIFAKINTLSTIAAALCFEEIVIGITSIIVLIVFGIKRSKHTKDNIKTEPEKELKNR